MTEQTLGESVAEGKILRIERTRALGAAQGDIETHTGKPERKTRVDGVDAALVRDTVGRVEALESERKMLADDIKEILAAAAEKGVDAKTVRELIRERKKKPEDAQRQLSLLPLYRDAMDAG